MLKTPTRTTRGVTEWCGPTALAVLTGLSYDEAYEKMKRAINRQRGKEAVARGLRRDYWKKSAFKGVSTYEIRIAGKALGLKIKWAIERGTISRRALRGTTLLTFVREHTVKGKTYLVVAGNHYVVVRDGLVYDNTRSNGGVCSIEDYPRAKLGRLSCYAEVRPKADALAG